MKKLTILLLVCALAMPIAAFANHASAGGAPVMKMQKSAGETIHVGVNGMVCDFCAQSLKKVFLKQGSVEKVDISLEDKLITLGLKPGKTMDDATIKKLVVDAGYEVSGIHHMQQAKKQ